VSERAERARLELAREGERLRVDNNLGADLEALILRAPDGSFHGLDGGLLAGARARLEPLEVSAPLGEALAGLLGSSLPLERGAPARADWKEALPRGCYLAKLARGVFRDDCGIETRELAGAHLVLGVLPLEAEAWQ
jgi:hypothetical protein